jgi:hypothetical protein
VTRLHSFKDLGSRELVSAAAAEHGEHAISRAILLQ